jgi:hypothetical protein
LRDKINERVGDGEHHNYPSGTVKELLQMINRFYIDPKTNKIIDPKYNGANLDRNKYSITESDKPNFSF